MPWCRSYLSDGPGTVSNSHHALWRLWIVDFSSQQEEQGNYRGPLPRHPNPVRDYHGLLRPDIQRHSSHPAPGSRTYRASHELHRRVH